MDNNELYIDFVNNIGKDKLACDGRLTTAGALLLSITALKMAEEFIDGVCKVLGVLKVNENENI